MPNTEKTLRRTTIPKSVSWDPDTLARCERASFKADLDLSPWLMNGIRTKIFGLAPLKRRRRPYRKAGQTPNATT
ncbi:hypothetical protein OpiT1DRAFT_05683 [Opitutaceae bacterium TAV1]|nr:hypothetical protein OpiT1DRAFT_05683 [Opitutaceae bacterium TAV1]